MKSRGSELLSVLTVLAVPAGIALVMPFGAFGFRAEQRERESAPVAAFVRLTADEEARSLRLAKTSWQGMSASVRNQRADIYFSELPAETFSSVMPVRERRPVSDTPVVECGLSPFLPSRRASPPVRIEAEGERKSPLPFSREELLKIN